MFDDFDDDPRLPASLRAYRAWSNRPYTDDEARDLLATFAARRAAFDAVLAEAGLTDRVTCPCCAFPGLPEHGRFDICNACGWEDDGLDDPNVNSRSPANGPTLTDARLSLGRHTRPDVRNLSGDDDLSWVDEWVTRFPPELAAALRAAAAII